MDHSSNVQPRTNISTLQCYCCVWKHLKTPPPRLSVHATMFHLSASIFYSCDRKNAFKQHPNASALSTLYNISGTADIRLPWRCFLNWRVSGVSDVTDGINTLGITPGCKHQKELFHLPTCHIQLCRVESPGRGKSMPLATRTREQSFDAPSPFCVNLSILSLSRCSLTSCAFPTSHFTNLSGLFLIPQTHRMIYTNVLTILCSCDNIWCRVLLWCHHCSWNFMDK